MKNEQSAGRWGVSSLFAVMAGCVWLTLTGVVVGRDAIRQKETNWAFRSRSLFIKFVSTEALGLESSLLFVTTCYLCPLHLGFLRKLNGFHGCHRGGPPEPEVSYPQMPIGWLVSR